MFDTRKTQYCRGIKSEGAQYLSQHSCILSFVGDISSFFRAVAAGVGDFRNRAILISARSRDVAVILLLIAGRVWRATKAVGRIKVKHVSF